MKFNEKKEESASDKIRRAIAAKEQEIRELNAKIARIPSRIWEKNLCPVAV